MPPENVRQQLEGIFTQILGTTDVSVRVTDLQKRFELFCACEKKFQHNIPNSLLHTIETVGDVIKHYMTPIDTITPLDQMRNVELPKNVHVQFDYVRFHPGSYFICFCLTATRFRLFFFSDTDTKFDGVTAFPGSSTIVTGLKYKDKYKGHKQKLQYPHII